MPNIIIEQSDHDPIVVHVSGKDCTIPVGTSVDVSDALVSLLANIPSVKFRHTGEPGDAAEEHPPVVTGFDADSIIEGTTDEVAARLDALNADELNCVREAEKDREVSRKGVLKAIDLAIANTNEENPDD